MKKLLKISGFALLFSALSLLLVFCSVDRYSKHAYAEATRDKPFDVIIVPGVPFEHFKTTKVMIMRLMWAKYLYDNGYTRNIIFSGSSVYSPYVEGITMKLIADTMGIPKDHTFAETKAEHSTENAYYGWKMAQKMGFKKIALATDPFQSSTLEGFLRHYCPGMKSIPIVFDKVDISTRELPKIALETAFVSDFVSIKKREGFIKRWRGTLGRRVIEESAREKQQKEVQEKLDARGSE